MNHIHKIPSIEPMLPTAIRWGLYILGMLILVSSSTSVIRSYIQKVDSDKLRSLSPEILGYNRLIAKSENIIIYILAWMGQFTALSLVFLAKSLLSREESRADSLFLISISLINFAYSIIISLCFKEITKFVTYLDYVKNLN